MPWNDKIIINLIDILIYISQKSVFGLSTLREPIADDAENLTIKQ